MKSELVKWYTQEKLEKPHSSSTCLQKMHDFQANGHQLLNGPYS